MVAPDAHLEAPLTYPQRIAGQDQDCRIGLEIESDLRRLAAAADKNVSARSPVRIPTSRRYRLLRSQPRSERILARADDFAVDIIGPVLQDLERDLREINIAISESGANQFLRLADSLAVHCDPADQRKGDLARIRRNQKHLLALVNDVLNFAKIEQGDIALRLAA